MDSPDRYGAVTRFFHWSIAVLIIWQLVSMAVKNALGRESELASFMVGTHASVGFTVFILVWLRVIWVFANRDRRPVHEAGLLGTAAKLGHLALYLLMLFVPTVAVLRAFGGTRPFTVWGIELFAGRPEGQEVAVLSNAGNLHGEMGWVMALLIAGHVAMALFHGIVLKDRTLTKMAGQS
ncbi:cytochrome b [Paracoccus sp. SCSIO 75233]|uniref:cytochrome b n=1 Tax=Paracoccus sp. SCSIO 75233 TaxID=3017782 RepID=UPI0022F0B461|nr:cytochrome b [Paracoccus sp. SCSIO 75233]WBU52452.1 cytochrome b [Paracoccus sp. SCSIO 75233]